MEKKPFSSKKSERLAALKKYDILGSAADNIFHELTELTASICNIPITMASLTDKDRVWYYTEAGSKSDVEIFRKISLNTYTILKEDILIIPDTLEDKHFFDSPLVTADPPFRFYAAIPLIVPEDHAIGTLCVMDTVPRKLNKKQIASLKKIRDNTTEKLEFQYLSNKFLKTNKYQKIVESIPDSIFIVSQVGNITFVNRQVQTLFGYPRKELLGKNIGVLFPKLSQDAKPLLISKTSKKLTTDNFVGHHKNGKQFSTEISFNHLTIENDAIFTLLIVRDITERNRINETLRLSEEKYAKAFHCSPDSISISSLDDGTFYDVNQQFQEKTGYTKEEMVGHPSAELKLWVDKKEREILIEEIQNKGNVTDMEIQFRTKHGDIQDLQISADLIDVKDKAHMLMVARDITQRKIRASQLLQIQKIDSIGQMAGSIAHDFNNLSTIIIGNLKFLQDEIGETIKEDDRKMIDSALKAAESGAQLTQGLLTISRKQVLQPETIEVNLEVKAFISLISRSLGKNINIISNKIDTPLYVHVDPNQLQNALVNLTLNSKDAMPEGGTLTVNASHENIRGNGNYAIISIIDTGSGMSKELANKVQEPFFTTKGINKGTGLGLSTVFEFAKQSGGKITIDSNPKKGTTVSIFLPIIEQYKNIDFEVPVTPELTTGTETILIVDDEPMVRMIGIKMLKKLGYKALEAANAEAAIKIIESRTDIDMLFSDIIMPGEMDGRALSHWVLKNRPDIKTLLTSGYYELSEEEKTAIQEPIFVLKKPYSISQLAPEIRNILDSK